MRGALLAAAMTLASTAVPAQVAELKVLAAGSLRAALGDAAREFVAFLLAPAGQALLARHGFAPP